MEPWRRCFRDGFAPHLPTAGLEALRAALETDDPRLIQGCTAHTEHCYHGPRFMQPVTGACAVGYCWWQGDDVRTVEDLESQFSISCWEADRLLGEHAANRFFPNWFDETPRDEMRRLLLPEVVLALEERAETVPG